MANWKKYLGNFRNCNYTMSLQICDVDEYLQTNKTYTCKGVKCVHIHGS